MTAAAAAVTAAESSFTITGQEVVTVMAHGTRDNGDCRSGDSGGGGGCSEDGVLVQTPSHFAAAHPRATDATLATLPTPSADCHLAIHGRGVRSG